MKEITKDLISILVIIAMLTAVVIFLVIPVFSKDTRETNFKWEYIESDGPDFYRAKIYGGWLVCRSTYTDSPITFIPLQNPAGWEIKPITNQNKAK